MILSPFETDIVPLGIICLDYNNVWLPESKLSEQTVVTIGRDGTDGIGP